MQAKWKSRLRYASFLVVVTVVGVEILGRIVLPQTDSPIRKKFDVTRKERRPYVAFGDPPYNGPRPASPRPPGEIRVFMLGGSTVEHGDPPISGHLEKELNEHGIPKARVYNYGVVSSVSGMELVRIVVDIAELEPDVIVMYNGANDLLQPTYGDPRPGYPIDFAVTEANPLVDTDDYPLGALIAYDSVVLRRFFPGLFVSAFTDLDRLREEYAANSESHVDACTDRYLQNLLKARRVSRSFGARFVAAFQPIVSTKEPRTPEEEEMNDSQTRRVWERATPRIRDRFAQWIAAGDVEPWAVADLTDAFDGIEEAVFWNSVHINEPFRPVIARRLRALVLRALESPALP